MTRFYTYKKSLSLLILFFISSIVFSQSDGDYRTSTTGTIDWSTVANWEVYNSGAWAAAAEYPGQSAGTGEVTINSGAQITLDLTPANAVGSLTFADGTTSATDVTFGNNSLTITGAVTFGNPSANAGDQFVYVNSGILTCASVTMVDTGDDGEDTGIEIEGGTLSVSGNISMADANRNTLSFVNSASGTLNIGGDFSGGSFVCDNSTVNLNGSGAQSVPATTYYNLTTSGADIKSLQSDATVSGLLTIDGTSTLTLNSNILTTAGNVTVNSGATLELDDNATLKLDDAATLSNSGIFKVVGTSGNVATVTKTDAGAGGYTISQTASGTVFHALYALFDYSGGITITDGTVDNTNNFGYTTFDHGTATEYLQLTNLNSIGGLSSIQSTVFNSGPTYNVSRTAGTGTVTFVDASGTFAGEINDNDTGTPGTLIEWLSSASTFYSTGNVSAGLTASWTSNSDGTGSNPSSLQDGSAILIVQDGHTVTFDNNIDSVYVNKLIVGGGTSGSFIIGEDATQKSLSVQELLEVKPGGSLTSGSEGAPAHIIRLYGNLVNNGTVNLQQSFTNVADVKVYGNMEIGGSVTSTFNNLTFAAGCNVKSNIAVDVNKNIYLESGATFNDGGFNHTVEYDWNNNGGTYNATGSLVFDGGTGSINATGTNTTFNDVTFSGGGLNVIKQGITVDGDLTITNNTQVSAGNVIVTINSNFSVESGSEYNQVQNSTNFNGTSAQTLSLDGSTSFNGVGFSNGGVNAKTIEGNIVAKGRVTINTGATVDGNDDYTFHGGLRINGTCNFTSTVTMKGGYIDASDAGVTNISIGTAKLIVDGNVYLRHTAGGSVVSVDMQNDVLIQNGYIVINDDARLTGQAGNTLTVMASKNLYIRGSDNFPSGFGTIDLDPASFVRYDVDIPQTIRGGGSVVYGHLYLNHNTKTVDEALTIKGNMYLYGALTLDLGTYTHVFSGYAIYNGTNNSSINGSNATFIIGDTDANQYIRENGTGNYTFGNLIFRQTGATAIRTKYFYPGCNITISNDLTIENIGGTSAIQMIVDLNDIDIAGPANNFSLGANCKLYTDNADFGANVISSFSGTKTLDVASTVYYTLDGAQNIAGGITYGSITFNNGDKTATGALDINADIFRYGGTPVFHDGGFTHTIAGDWRLNSTNYYTSSSATGTVVFDGVNQEIDGYNFNNITIASSGTVNVARSLTIFGDLTVNDGSSLDVATLSITIGGDVTVVGTGVYTQTTGTTTMNGSADQTLSLNSSCLLGNFTINKPTPTGKVTVATEMHVTGNTTITSTAGVLDISNRNIYLGGRLYVRENAGVPNFITTGSTVYFNGSTGQYIYNYHEDDLTFNNVDFSGSGDKTFTYSNPAPAVASTNLVVNGNLTINNCVVDGHAMEMYVRGNWVNNGTFNHYRTVRFDGANQSISSSSFYHVKFVGSDTKTLTGGINVAYDLYIDSVATLDANNYDITLGRSWYNDTTTAGYTPGTGKVIFNGASSTNIYTGTTSGSQAGKNFYQVEINKTGTTYLHGDLVVANDFILSSGTFYTYEHGLWVGGDFDVAGTFNANSSANEITLNASGGTKVFNPNGAALRKVVIDAPGTTYNLGSDFSVQSADMSIANGSLIMNGNRLKVLDSGRKIDISGGTLKVDTGAVVEFTNTQSLNLSSGNLYIVGADGNLAQIENTSTTASRLFSINATGGTVFANYYKIQQGNLTISGSATIDATNNLSNGIYTNGAGAGAYLTLTGLDFSDFTVDNVVFNAGSTYNVSRTSGSGVITFNDATGGLAGESYEEDDGVPGTLISWTYPAGYYWDGGAGTSNWNDANNWESNTIPSLSDIVYLNHKHVSAAYTVDVSTSDGACERLTMDSGGGNTITLNIGSGRKLDVAQDVTIGSSTTLAQADNTAMLYVGNSWTNLGTYTHNNSTITFNGASGNYIIASGGTGAGKSFYNFVVDAQESSQYGLDATIKVENNLTITTGIFDLASPNNDVTINGDWYIDQANGGSFEASTADVVFSGTDQTVTNGIFYNLIIASSGTTTLGSNIAVENVVTINSGSTFDGQDNNIYVRRHWQNDGGTFTQSSLGTVVFDGISTQYVDQGTSSTTFSNVTFSNRGTKYLNRDVTVNGDVLINASSGTVDVRTHQLTGNGVSNTLTCNKYLQIEGADNFPQGFETIDFATYSYVFYYADITQNIYPTTYGNLRLRRLTNDAATPVDKIATGNLIIKGSLQFDYEPRPAVLDMATNDVNITLTGSITMTPGSSITWGTGNSTLTHVGANWYIDEDITGFNNLILAGTGAKYLQGNTTQSALAITGDLEIKSGIDLRMYATTSAPNNYRRISGTASKTISMETGSRIFNSTPASVAVAIPEGFGTYDFNENSTYYMYSGSDQTIFTGSNIVYGNLIFYYEKSVTSDGVADLNIDGNWDVNVSTYYDGGKDVKIAGANIYLTNYVPSSTARKIILDGPRDQRILDNRNNSVEVATLQISGTNIKTIGDGNDVVIINGDMIIDNDVTATTNRSVTFNGANWTNSGIYKQTGNTLNFNGVSDQTIDAGASNAENHFYNIEFSNASTKTFVNNGADINGDLTINAGTVELGSLSYNLYDELYNTAGGTLNSSSANITFDGTYQDIMTPAFKVNNLTCSGQYRKRMFSDWTINGDLIIESGVQLNTSDGASVPNYYDIFIKGDWTNNGTFIDYTSKVTFNGALSPVNITSGGYNFYDVDFAPTSAVTYKLLSDATRFDDVMNIGTDAELSLNGKTLTIGRNNAVDNVHTVDGTLTIDGGAKLIVNNYPTQDTINVNGTFNMVGADNSHVATLSSERTDNRSKSLINIESGATLNARYYLVEYIADEGLNLKPGSTLDATNNLSDGTWLNLRNVQDARYMILEASYSGDTISNISFGYNGVPTQGKHYNVQRKITSSVVVFKNVTGALGSFRFEDDDQLPSSDIGYLHWPTVTETYWIGDIDVDWHKAGNWDNGVPTANKDAIIPDRDNDPVIFNGDAECKSLKITDGLLRLESDRGITAHADVSIADGMLYVNSTSSNITVGGDWIVDTQGHFSHGNATVTFNSGEGSAMIVPGSSDFYNLVFDNALTTFSISSSEMDVDGDFVINSGTVSPSVNNYNFNFKGDYTINSGSYNTSSASNGTIVLNGDGDQTITNGIFYNLKVEGSGDKLCDGTVSVYGKTTISSTLKALPGSTIDFKGDMQINSSGTFNDGDESHTFNGINWYGDGTYAGSGTVTFNRTNGNQNLYAASFNNLVVDCTHRTLYLKGDVNVTGDVTVNAGVTSVYLDTFTITSDGTGTYTVGDDNINVYVYGVNNFPKAFSSYDISALSYTRYYGGSDQNVAGVPYGHLVLNYENTKTLTGNVEVKGNLYFNNSTLDVSASNYTIIISGRWYNTSTGNFICRQSDVIFNGTENQYIYSTASNLNDFYNLTVSSSNIVYAYSNTSNDFVIKNNLTVTSGQFSASGRVIYIGGDMTTSGSGSYVNNTGTYYLRKAAGSANISVNGSSLLNLTINSGATYTAQDNISLVGDFNLIAGVFDGNGKTINLGNGGSDIVTIDGTYKVGNSGVLGIGNGTSLKVNSGGRIEVVGGKVSNNSSGGRYSFTVEGEIAADNYIFENMASSGIYLTPSSTIDATYHFSNGTFSDGATTGQLFRVENTQSFTGANRIENVSFPNNPGGSASNISKYSSASGTLEFYNSSGVFAGESFDNDPNDLIDWTGPVKLTWNGSVDTDWNNVSNWSASSGSPIVPISSTDVIIPGGLVNYPNLITHDQHSGSLTIDNGGQLKINTPADAAAVDLDINGSFVINGQLQVNSTNDYITVESDWYRGTSGVVVSKGVVTFDGTAGVGVINNRGTAFNNLVFAGTAQYQLGYATTVSGDLTINPGATFGASSGDYALTVKGDWINNGTFNAEQGELILGSETSNRNINCGTSAFYDVTINSTGYTYTLASSMRVTNDLGITAGTLDLNANTLRIGNTISISGELKVNAGATLDMDNGAALAVNNGGSIELLGTDNANRATLTSSSSGRYSFDVNSGGSIKAQYYQVDYTDADGLYMAPGANIDATNNLSDGIFSNGYPNSGSYMTLLHEMGVDDFTLKNLVFNSGPKYNVTRTSGTTIFHFEDANGDLGNYLYEKDDEVTPSPSSGLLQWPYVKLYTWEGDVNSNWGDAGNWFDSQLPGEASTVTIKDDGGSNPIIKASDGEILITGMTVESGTVTLQPGSRVTLKGDLNTADASNVVIQNTVVSPTVLINEGATDAVTVEWIYPNNRYMYVGHSVDGVTYSDYSTPIVDPANDLWLYRWPNVWTRITTNVAGNDGLAGSEETLEGYAVKTKTGSDVTVSHVGNLRNSTYNSTFDGYKLVANPYAAYIDLDDLDSDIGTADPTVWTSANGSGELAYATYNLSNGQGANGGTQYVAPGQSFWIQHTANSTLTIRPTLRGYGDNGVLKGAMLTPNDVLRISLNDESNSDELVVLFRYGGAVDELTEYDSKKRMGSSKIVPNIYAVKGGSKIVIGTYPNNAAGVDTIKLGYNFSQKKLITLRATNLREFSAIDDIYLFDKKEGIEVNLRDAPEYTFMSTGREDADRFVLYFTHVTTGTNGNGGALAREGVHIYGTGQKGFVKVNEEILASAKGKGIIRLYNASGSMLKEFNLTDIKTTIDLPEAYGVYIITVSTDDMVVTGKVSRVD